ncbi:MAG: hypothetical protein O9338_11590, partial [Microcystis sp. LE19-251.1A]|nr:hypothetical protein [Microcystis sp. LE19-251.1A]
MMLATETIVQVSILGYLFSDLKEAGGRSQEEGVRRQETGDRRQEAGDRRQETGDRRLFLFILPTPPTPHPTPQTPHPPTPTPHPKPQNPPPPPTKKIWAKNNFKKVKIKF